MNQQLNQLKLLLEKQSNEDDVILQFYLDRASDIICEIRNSDIVEKKYYTVQVAMSIEMYNKRGAEGETSHSEIGIGRTYEASDISPSLLSKVTPIVKTPFSKVRVIDNENIG